MGRCDRDSVRKLDGACCQGPAPADHRPPAACPIGPHLAYFEHMIPRCLEYAQQAKRDGRAVVGILCEYTPRELILAAGAVPVCLCGGTATTIPAAEEDLPANLCPLIKSTYGYDKLGSNPFLEMADAVVAETTCDGKKKMYELMARRRRMLVLELPQKPGDADARVHWLAEVRKLRDNLQDMLKVEITDRKLREAISLMNRERRLRRELALLMARPDPPLTGCQLLQLKSSISGIASDLQQYERALADLSAAPPAPAAGSRVRVLLTGVPTVHGAHRVLEIIEDCGGLVVCMENCTGVKPLLEDVDESAGDPLTAIADKYFHLGCSVMTPNDARLELLERLVGQYRPACIVDLVWQACLTYDVESTRVRDLADRVHLPYLRIGTDYSPSDSARIALRVEALLESVQARAGMDSGAGTPTG